MPLKANATNVPRRGCLARAGWSLAHSSSKGCLEAKIEGPPPPEFEAEGARLVAEVAASWSKKYIHMIRHHGVHDGAFHYECLFSCPTKDVPVPAFAVSVRFALVVQPCADVKGTMRPRLMYSFEEGDLRHEWVLEKDARGKWRATTGQQTVSVKNGYFEKYLDKYIQEKEKAHARGINLVTSFEVSRLKPTLRCDCSEDSSDEGLEVSGVLHESSKLDGSEISLDKEYEHRSRRSVTRSISIEDGSGQHEPELAGAIRAALKIAGLECEKLVPPTSIIELLTNIFDAADEESVGELPHFEVARVLAATLPGFGLEEWDIFQLLMSAGHEKHNGFIELKPFIQAAPELIQELRKRRISYRERGLPGIEIPSEAIKYCFGDEIGVTTASLMHSFEQCGQEDNTRGLYYYIRQQVMRRARSLNTLNLTNTPLEGSFARRSSMYSHEDMVHDGLLSPESTGAEGEERVLVALKRKFCQQCIRSLPERVSPQEAERLMQMLPEDEDGFVDIYGFDGCLEQLRMEALLNALVETDAASLKTHLVQQFCQLGITEDGKVKVWAIKHALLTADKLCLSRLQIRILLCLANADIAGNVDMPAFLGMCCAVIPHMFDAKTFVETAERLQIEQAERIRHNENAELAALGAARVNTLGQGGEEKSQEIEVDQETVERTLVQLFALSDDTHQSPPTLSPEVMFDILQSNDAQMQSCQLSELEVCGLAAEMILDDHGKVAYVDHVKRWVPTLFELRKHEFLGAYLLDNASESLGIQEPEQFSLEDIVPWKEENSEMEPVILRPRRGSRSQSKKPTIMMGESPTRFRTCLIGIKGASLGSDGDRSSKELPPGRGLQRRRTLLTTGLS